uniref:Mitochondrial carrier protein n=1 Tax=Phaeomonas parva TaxID=124430 RepID=A0A7S1TUF2_9STRA
MPASGDTKAKAKPEAERYQPKAPFLSGALAGGLEISLTFPLEFIKTEQQLRAAAAADGRSQAGMVDIARATVRRFGPQGLYRGLPPWLFFAFPRSAVRFSVFEHSLAGATALGLGSAADPRLTAACGFLSGAVEAASVMTPMQNVQIKLMHDAHRPAAERRYPRFFASLWQIPRDLGVVEGLFAGMVPTVVKGAVNSMIRFSIYERAKESVARALGADGDSTAVHMLSGAMAGGVSAYVTHPIDTVKAQMMSLHGGSYGSSLECFLSVYRGGGVAALYCGITPRVIRVCMEVALQFALFEKISRIIDGFF